LKANSGSATAILLLPKTAISFGLKVLSFKILPANGPFTPICLCPSKLVAAIFQPVISELLSA